MNINNAKNIIITYFRSRGVGAFHKKSQKPIHVAHRQIFTDRNYIIVSLIVYNIEYTLTSITIT